MPARNTLSASGHLVAALSLLAALATSALAQDRVHVAYPERDALTPFRNPAEVYAPPDRLFAVLRRMRAIAADPTQARQTDERGREIIQSDNWRKLLGEVESIGLDAGYLAAVMRTSKNGDDRRTAFYAMFYCDRVDYILNLISHIPGEPAHATRQAAFPRAVDYLRVHLTRRFGDLDVDQKKAVLAAMPEPGSPAARSAGIVRAPRDGDHLNQLTLIPFIQLISVDEPIDQAQGLWFLKEVFAMRSDLAERWLEPALPRLRQLLTAESEDVRKQLTELLQTIGPKDLPAAPTDGETTAMRDWAEAAFKGLFPPIRNLNDALIQLFPSAERTAIAKAAVEALESSSIGDPFQGKNAAGQHYRGFRIAHVPETLLPLSIPKGSVIISINGVGVHDAKSLLDTARTLIETLAHPRTLMVEYVLEGKSHAVEYRIM